MKTLRLASFGIRGFVGGGLTPEAATNFALAFATVNDGGRVLVGRDTRRSSDLFHLAVVAGLRSAGCEVVDLGICPTPVLQWLVPREQPLRILGPPGTRALVEALGKAHAAGGDALGEALGLPAEGVRTIVQEVDDGFREEIGELRLEARALPGGPLPALAWAFCLPSSPHHVRELPRPTTTV